MQITIKKKDQDYILILQNTLAMTSDVIVLTEDQLELLLKILKNEESGSLRDGTIAKIILEKINPGHVLLSFYITDNFFKGYYFTNKDIKILIYKIEMIKR